MVVLTPYRIPGVLVHKLGAAYLIFMVSAGAGAAAQHQLGLLAWRHRLSASRGTKDGGVIDTSQKHREAEAHERGDETALDELSRPRASDPCLANDK